MPRIRIFVSFDGEHDTDLHDRLRAESARSGSTFELCGWSQGGAMTETWTQGSRRRIREADEMVVICGQYTDVAPRVDAELRIAQEEGKPYMLLWGRRELMCKKPEGAGPGDPMYSWTREILETQISTVLRSAEPLRVPESCKRAPA